MDIESFPIKELETVVDTSFSLKIDQAGLMHGFGSWWSTAFLPLTPSKVDMRPLGYDMISSVVSVTTEHALLLLCSQGFLLGS